MKLSTFVPPLLLASSAIAREYQQDIHSLEDVYSLHERDLLLDAKAHVASRSLLHPQIRSIHARMGPEPPGSPHSGPVAAKTDRPVASEAPLKVEKKDPQKKAPARNSRPGRMTYEEYLRFVGLDRDREGGVRLYGSSSRSSP